jgi:UDP-2,4-diacetamido-2,4,6-trideoxy-beta-L-altropyranose hydrolase
MRVFILTEGGSNIGIGHITRCASLYEALEDKGMVPEFVINGDETVNYLLKDKNHKIFDWLQERERLYSLIKGADIVFIDSYLAGHDVYTAVSSSAKLCVYIDDNNRIDYPKGIIVNGGINAEDPDYSVREDVTYLLGPRYTPLRKEFWDVPEENIKEKVESVMITFGGDDNRNMTPKVLKALAENYPDILKKVIIGKGFINIADVEDAIDNKTEIIYYPDSEGMIKVMLESDIAVSAGGQTLYELARVGVPTIAVAVADNQTNNIDGWRKNGFIDYAGWWEDGDLLDNIVKNVESLSDIRIRDKMAGAGRSLVDGQGAKRIVESLCLMLKNI